MIWSTSVSYVLGSTRLEKYGRVSTRSVPPRWLEAGAITAVQTEPLATASALGLLLRGMVFVGLRVIGSIRESVASPPFATQTAPSPTATATGPPPTVTGGPTTPLRGSMRKTVP